VVSCIFVERTYFDATSIALEDLVGSHNSSEENSAGIANGGCPIEPVVRCRVPTNTADVFTVFG